MASKVYRIRRKDGSLSPKWYGRPWINGKRTQRAFSIYEKVAQDALDALNKVNHEQDDGRIPQNMPWDHFKHLVLKFSVNKRKKRTHYFNRKFFDWVDKHLFIKTINQMTPERLEMLDLTLAEEDYAPVMKARVIRAGKTLMKWAEKRKFVPMQDWQTVEVFEPAHRDDFYTKEAYSKLLSKLSGNALTSAWLMGRAGLRLSEVYNLEWSDIQFEHRRIIFKSKPHLGFKIKGEKKKLITREIPLTLDEDLDQQIEPYLKSIARPQGFVISEDRPTSVDWYSKQMCTALEATGIRTYKNKFGSAHVLRHTFGSHLAQDGVPLQVIQLLMGHADLRMTMVYSHLLPTNLTGARLKRQKSLMEKTSLACTTFVPPKNQASTTTAYLDQNSKDAVDVILSSESYETLRKTTSNNDLGR